MKVLNLCFPVFAHPLVFVVRAKIEQRKGISVRDPIGAFVFVTCLVKTKLEGIVFFACAQ